MREGSLVAGKTEPVEIQFENTNNTIHDIDMFAHGPLNYNFEKVVPTNFDGDTLALMFPRGFSLRKIGATRSNMANHEFVKKWYFVWNLYNFFTGCIMRQWSWEGLPEEIDQADLEGTLIRNGKIAFVEYEGVYLVAPFDATEKDIYDNPKEIILNVPNREFKDIKFTKFVIIKNNFGGQPLYNECVQYLEWMFNITQQLYINLYAAAPKGVFLQTAMTDENGEPQVISQALNSIAYGTQPFYTLQVGKDMMNDLRYQQLLNGEGGKNPLYLPIELSDRSEALIRQREYAWNELKQTLGLDINLQFDKKERLVANEVDVSNSVSALARRDKVESRRSSIEKINKMFNLNIELITREDEEEEKVEEIEKEEIDYAVD